MQSGPFGTGDFFETRQGACRLMPPVTRMLAETGPRWTAALAPIVEGITQTLMHSGASPTSATSSRRLPTPLTQSNRSAGRANVRKRNSRKPQPSATVPATCLNCGTILDDVANRYCDDCLPEIRKEQGTVFALAGPATLAKRWAAGTDLAHGGDAGKARGKRNASHHAANAQWEQNTKQSTPTHDEMTPESFTREIVPMLATVPVSVMAAATGLTPGYCSFV